MKERLEYLEWLSLDVVSMKKIEHEDSMSSEVFKLQKKDGTVQILKIYFDAPRWRRECYFLEMMPSAIPVPEVLDVIEPSEERRGAVLMSCLEGEPLKMEDLTEELAIEMGEMLARLHSIPIKRYGDLSLPGGECNPKEELRSYFERSVKESNGVLPKDFLEKCRRYFDKHVAELKMLDGPCVTHRDYRPGNVMVSEGKIQGVIDWEIARGGFSQEDFAHMEHVVWSKDESSKAPFLEGYARLRKVPSFEGSLPILRFCKALGVIGLTITRGTWQKDHRDIFNANAAFLTDEVER
jgi:Ser/Thr protein kinase RdoA (MazF antagonist)